MCMTKKSPHCDKAILNLVFLFWVFVYGSQLMAYTLGGHVDTAPVSEYGRRKLQLLKVSCLKMLIKIQ